ncbi:MAG: OmpA family protein [Flavobacteriales bacterium]|nr:OmpA family protein [Flavobacteriales bacterium]
MRWNLLLPVLLMVPDVTAQNLVVNGSFEQHARCPERFDAKPIRGVHRTKPIGGMPGYFHPCSEVMGTPANWAGIQAPFDGEAYAGLVLTAHGGGECAVREFVQLELAEPLVNGGKYRLEFHVSLADRSGYMTDRIGASFSVHDRSGKKGVAEAFGRPDVDNTMNRFIADTAVWAKVEGIYSARGGERFVQLGNFQLCDRTSRKAVTPNKGGGLMHNMKHKGEADLDPDRARGLRRKLLATQAYVYIDAVSLTQVNSTAEARVLEPTDACGSDPGRPPATLDLVPDPGFDATIPAHRSAWKNASGGTPDFEEGRTGIYLYSAVNKDHREYIHTPLKERLDPCGIYAIRLRILRNATYAYMVDRIGVSLTEEFENDRRRGLLSFPLRWEIQGQGVFDDTRQWTTLCGTFNGGGCANRLLVGNFAGDDSTTIVQRNPEDGPFAYYFVDDVSLWRTGTVVGCALRCPEAITAVSIEADSTSTAPHWPLVLYFDVNDHVPGDDLLPTAEELFKILAQQPSLRVRVEGHTDESGNRNANLKLAENRAKAVRDELVRLGLPRKLFTMAVLGSSEPIATNTTEEGRALNRRVEIELVGTE